MKAQERECSMTEERRESAEEVLRVTITVLNARLRALNSLQASINWDLLSPEADKYLWKVFYPSSGLKTQF